MGIAVVPLLQIKEELAAASIDAGQTSLDEPALGLIERKIPGNRRRYPGSR
jgi:hypothetical protein